MTQYAVARKRTNAPPAFNIMQLALVCDWARFQARYVRQGATLHVVAGIQTRLARGPVLSNELDEETVMIVQVDWLSGQVLCDTLRELDATRNTSLNVLFGSAIHRAIDTRFEMDGCMEGRRLLKDNLQDQVYPKIGERWRVRFSPKIDQRWVIDKSLRTESDWDMAWPRFVQNFGELFSPCLYQRMSGPWRSHGPVSMNFGVCVHYEHGHFAFIFRYPRFKCVCAEHRSIEPKAAVFL